MKSGYGTAELVLVRLSALKHADPKTAESQLRLVEQEGEQPVLERTAELTAAFEAVHLLTLAHQHDYDLVPAGLWEDAITKVMAWRESLRWRAPEISDER